MSDLPPDHSPPHAPASPPMTVHCRHCGEPLHRDWLWGWMHAGSRYLCRDAVTGALLCAPAQPDVETPGP